MAIDAFIHIPNPETVTVGELRQQYGDNFAETFPPATPLAAVLAAAHVQTLAQYLQKTGE